LVADPRSGRQELAVSYKLYPTALAIFDRNEFHQLAMAPHLANRTVHTRPFKRRSGGIGASFDMPEHDIQIAEARLAALSH
jgi:hypothetical protein